MRVVGVDANGRAAMTSVEGDSQAAMSSRGEVVAESIDDAKIGLRAQIREDWITHGRDSSLAGFRALAVYRLGAWRMGIRSALLRKPVSLIYNVLYKYVRNHYGIELPYTAKIGRRVMIAHQGTIVLHESAEIGDDCLIRHGVTIGAASHRRSHDAPRLQRGVQVGAGAMILGKIVVGEGALIGANAVVTEDVPPRARVVVGPMRVILPREHATNGDGRTENG